MNVVLLRSYTDVVRRRQTYMYMKLYMYVLVCSPYMYVNTRNSTYWYVRVRSVSVYSTQAAFEMSTEQRKPSKYIQIWRECIFCLIFSSLFASASPGTKHEGAHMLQREGTGWSEGKTIAHQLM